MIQGLTTQIKGDFSYNEELGLMYVIEFPKRTGRISHDTV